MNLRRLHHSFAITLLLTLMGAILAACGGTATTPATTAVTQATTAATSGGAAATTPPAATTETMAAMTTTAAEAATTAAAVTAAATTAATTAATDTSTAASATGTTAATTSDLTGNILRIGAPTFPDSLDPQAESFSNEIPYSQLANEGLTRLDKGLKTVPGAAESWEYNKDDTAITFTLRSGLKYSDGSHLKASDFAHAVYRTADPRNPGDYASSFDMIKGATELQSAAVPTDTAKIPDLRKAMGVKVIDDTHISFQFTQPTPYFQTIASTWIMFPTKVDWGDAKGDNWWQTASNHLSNGPFVFSKIDTQGEVLEFKPNPNYWGDKPKVDGVSVRFIKDLSVGLQAYKNNEIDIFGPDPNDIADLKADPELGQQYHESVGSCTLEVEFNQARKPFDNKNVREAFAYALDRDAFIRDAQKGTYVKTLGWIPPGFPGYDATEKRFDFDPAKAKAALAAAGYPGGKGFPEVKYSYSSSNPANQARVEYLIQMFQKNLGVTLTPDPVEGKTLTAMRKKAETHPLLNIGGWCSDYPDPQDWLSVYWNSSQSFAKVLGYKDPAFDKLTNAADAEPDPAKRMQEYLDAQKLLIANVNGAIFGNSKNIWLIKPAVQGLQFSSQDSADFPGSTTSLQGVSVTKQ